MGGNCTQASDCGNKGNCVHNFCSCDNYITGDYCQISFAQELGAGFVFWRFFFMVAFLVATVYTGIRMHHFIIIIFLFFVFCFFVLLLERFVVFAID